MKKEKNDLTSRVLSANRQAESGLTADEKTALEAGTRFTEKYLADKVLEYGGELPAGAEDEAIEEAEKKFPGYETALDKWASDFRSDLKMQKKVKVSGQ